MPEIDATLQQLHAETNQSWKDTNSLLLNDLLRYDQLLGEYLTKSEKALQAKQEEIWERTQTVADALGMSPDTHVGLAMNMLEHLPTTPTGFSFTSGIPLLMAHSPEVLAYQGQGIKGSSFQLTENSTAAAVPNQKLQQLLTVPEPTTAPLNLDASIPTETITPLTGSQVHQSHPAKQLYTGLDSLSKPDTECQVEATLELGDEESIHSSSSGGSYRSSERGITGTKKLADTSGDESDSTTSLGSEGDASTAGEEVDNASGSATHSTHPEGNGSSNEEPTVPSTRSISAPPTLTVLEGEDSEEEQCTKCHADAQRMDTNLNAWHNKLSTGEGSMG